MRRGHARAWELLRGGIFVRLGHHVGAVGRRAGVASACTAQSSFGSRMSCRCHLSSSQGLTRCVPCWTTRSPLFGIGCFDRRPSRLTSQREEPPWVILRKHWNRGQVPHVGPYSGPSCSDSNLKSYAQKLLRSFARVCSGGGFASSCSVLGSATISSDHVCVCVCVVVYLFLCLGVCCQVPGMGRKPAMRPESLRCARGSSCGCEATRCVVASSLRTVGVASEEGGRHARQCREFSGRVSRRS